MLDLPWWTYEARDLVEQLLAELAAAPGCSSSGRGPARSGWLAGRARCSPSSTSRCGPSGSAACSRSPPGLLCTPEVHTPPVPRSSTPVVPSGKPSGLGLDFEDYVSVPRWGAGVRPGPGRRAGPRGAPAQPPAAGPRRDGPAGRQPARPVPRAVLAGLGAGRVDPPADPGRHPVPALPPRDHAPHPRRARPRPGDRRGRGGARPSPCWCSSLVVVLGGWVLYPRRAEVLDALAGLDPRLVAASAVLTLLGVVVTAEVWQVWLRALGHRLPALDRAPALLPHAVRQVPARRAVARCRAGSRLPPLRRPGRGHGAAASPVPAHPPRHRGRGGLAGAAGVDGRAGWLAAPPGPRVTGLGAAEPAPDPSRRAGGAPAARAGRAPRPRRGPPPDALSALMLAAWLLYGARPRVPRPGRGPRTVGVLADVGAFASAWTVGLPRPRLPRRRGVRETVAGGGVGAATSRRAGHRGRRGQPGAVHPGRPLLALVSVGVVGRAAAPQEPDAARARRPAQRPPEPQRGAGPGPRPRPARVPPRPSADSRRPSGRPPGPRPATAMPSAGSSGVIRARCPGRRARSTGSSPWSRPPGTRTRGRGPRPGRRRGGPRRPAARRPTRRTPGCPRAGRRRRPGPPRPGT